MDKAIYLDHASTTPTDPEVVEAMLPWFTEEFGNPSTVYSLGLTAAAAVQEARESIAGMIGAEADEIYFTSAAPRATTGRSRGIARSRKDKGKHIVTSTIEHHAVLDTMEFLEKHRVRGDTGAGRLAAPDRSGGREEGDPQGHDPHLHHARATTRWAPSSRSPRSARSPAKPASSSTPTWCRPSARSRPTSTS